jgi:RNA polymerase sigma factor (sigma-70 family)
MIYGISRRFRLMPEDCVDVFGQVCKSLLENLGKLRSSDHLAGYIATTTQRACLALIRERDRRVRMARAAQDEGLFPEQLDLDPDEAARSALRAHTVRRALRRQDERCRELLRALFFDETQPSYDEISRTFALPVSSIGPTRSRCLEKFRKTLEGMGFTKDGIRIEG